MTAWLQVHDNAKTTLASELTIGGLSVALTSGASFPAANFILTICAENGTILEKLLIDSRSSNTLTVNASGRGYGGTAAAVHSAGDIAFIGSIEHSLEEIQAAVDLNTAKVTNATHTGDATGSGALTVVSASDTVAGKVELATIAEVSTGSAADRAVTPDALAGSNYGRRVAIIKIIDDITVLTTGDNKYSLPIPIELNGWNLVRAEASVSTVSSSGALNIDLYNVTDSTDMLSTNITIDANEKTSYTAATPSAVNPSFDDVITGDEIRIDCDGSGTGAKGLSVILSFSLP